MQYGIYLLRQKPFPCNDLYALFEKRQFIAVCQDHSRADSIVKWHRHFGLGSSGESAMEHFWVELIKITAGDEAARESMSAAVVFIHEHYLNWHLNGKMEQTLALFRGSATRFCQEHEEEARDGIWHLTRIFYDWYSAD